MKLHVFRAARQAGPLLVFLFLGLTFSAMHLAYAQESTPSNPVGYTNSDDPHGPLAVPGWIAGMSIVGAMSGVGVWAAIRRR